MHTPGIMCLVYHSNHSRHVDYACISNLSTRYAVAVQYLVVFRSSSSFDKMLDTVYSEHTILITAALREVRG